MARPLLENTLNGLISSSTISGHSKTNRESRRMHSLRKDRSEGKSPRKPSKSLDTLVDKIILSASSEVIGGAQHEKSLNTSVYTPSPQGEGFPPSPKRTLSLNELVKYLATKTNGFSGAHLKLLCDEAKLQSLGNCNFEFTQSLTEECFEKALEIILKDRVIIRKKEKLVKGAIK
jgi:SpoVK/Ycf46/Vps4 family AAA+-type ATPase